MDSITQATLGAAVGEIVLGHKAGNRAIFWGGVAGTLPDLDILAYPLMDQIAQLGWHRGPSHAFFFLTIAAPILGIIIHKIKRKEEITWRNWTFIVYFAFITHVLLDAFTIYGTQLFQPFNNWPVSLNSISIVDPLYTIPLMISVIVIMFISRNSTIRRKIIIFGLTVSTLYIGIAFGNKFHVNSVARLNFEANNIIAEKFITTPTIFNSLLWRVTAKADDGFYVGYYSILDSSHEINFSYLPQNSHLLESMLETDAVKRLFWFSRGYYIVREVEGQIQFADIRFGTIDVGRPESSRFIFEWALEASKDNPTRGKISKIDFSNVDFNQAFGLLWQRILGI
jgi:inner membrane protein